MRRLTDFCEPPQYRIVRKTLREYCFQYCREEIPAQWHPTKNAQLKPDDYLPGSHTSVLWQCSEGHEWRAVIKSRVEGNGCPVCSNRVAVTGLNDLESAYPLIANKNWHPSKNGSLKPSQVVSKSERKVWWRCNLGHEWQTTVSSRTFSKSGCPYCSNRKVLAGFNDLATVEPKVAAQWHPTRNAPLEPKMVMRGIAKRVWWKCPLGHEWKAVIYSRAGVQKCGCPVCAGMKPE